MALAGPKSDDSGDDGIFAEINITPLTDIFLVLLIIFMVTSSAIVESQNGSTGLKVNLPKGGATDVRTTRDGAFFLLHDSTLERTTDGSGSIDQVDSDVVRKLSAGGKFAKPYAGVLIPSLDDFLAATAGKINLYFDAKAIPPAALAKAIQKYQMTDRTVVYQSADYLEKLKAIEPKIRGLPPLSRAGDIEKIAARIQPYAFDAKWDILSKEVIDRCHKAGVKVFSDSMGKHETINDFLQAMDWGIDLIQTDHPMRVMRAIELRAAKRINVE